jgi:hypothetical protein
LYCPLLCEDLIVKTKLDLVIIQSGLGLKEIWLFVSSTTET